MQIVNNTRQLDIISIVGMPVMVNSTLMNCAVIFQKGKILGLVPKTYLPNYKEFYEQRWFTPSVAHPDSTTVRLCGQVVPMSARLLFDTPEVCFGVEICEDVWAPVPPSSTLVLKGAEIIFNLSADTENICKHQYLRSLLAQQSARCLAGYVFSSCGFGESTTDVVFAGNALIYENGSLLAASERFSFEEQLVISEIDVERLRGERLVNTTFAASVRTHQEIPVQHVSTELVSSRELSLTRPVEPHPSCLQAAVSWMSAARKSSPFRWPDWPNVWCIPIARPSYWVFQGDWTPRWPCWSVSRLSTSWVCRGRESWV